MVYFHHHVNRKPLINQLKLGGSGDGEGRGRQPRRGGTPSREVLCPGDVYLQI